MENIELFYEAYEKLSLGAQVAQLRNKNYDYGTSSFKCRVICAIGLQVARFG